LHWLNLVSYYSFYLLKPFFPTKNDKKLKKKKYIQLQGEINK